MEFALSGQQALEILRSHRPPEVMYIFSDINMPGMTGLEFVEKVKSEFPQIQVSMISAYGDSENHDLAMSSGAKEFFTKPIDFNSLKTEISTQAIKLVLTNTSQSRCGTTGYRESVVKYHKPCFSGLC